VIDLALLVSFRQAPHVRRFAIFGLVCALASSAAADQKRKPAPTVYPAQAKVFLQAPPQAMTKPSSNPAFLGIKMIDHGAGCLVEGVTPGSAADDAALREWDLILAIDGVLTPTCTTLRAQIISNSPGHVAKLDVRRGTERIELQAPLSTRAEVLHRRLVGHSMDPTDVVDADNDKQSYDLAEMHGKTTVVGWFMLERCAGCSQVFDRISDSIADRMKGDTSPFVLAVSPEPQASNMLQGGGGLLVARATPPAPVRKSYGFTTNVPLAIASDSTFTELAIDDPERIHFMVIDCRGVVRFVAPIAPGSDDIDAAVDEVLAAAEQAEHSRAQRR
jgi:hypothetical protein